MIRTLTFNSQGNEIDENCTGDSCPIEKPVKDRLGKVEPTLVEPEFIRAMARVRQYGNSKYPSADNWRGNDPALYRDAAYRHWLAYLDGERFDDESGLPHLAHLAVNVMFLYWLEGDLWITEE